MHEEELQLSESFNCCFLVFINVANVNICELKYGSEFRQTFIFHSLFLKNLLPATREVT